MYISSKARVIVAVAISERVLIAQIICRVEYR